MRKGYLLSVIAALCACSEGSDRPPPADPVEGDPNRISAGQFGGAAIDTTGSESGSEQTPETTAVDFECFEGLPSPQLSLIDAVRGLLDGGAITYVEFSVDNWFDYPAELFSTTDALGPCGQNPRPSRTWIDFEDEQRRFIGGFCVIDSPGALARIGVELPGAHDAIAIVVRDRACGIEYASELLVLP